MDGWIVPILHEASAFGKAADERTERYLMKHLGELLTVTVHTKGRNREKHNLFMLVLDRAVDSLRKPDGSEMYKIENWKDKEKAIEDLKESLKWVVGFTITRVNPLTGKEITSARPYNFAECDEESAEIFREAAYMYLSKALGCTVRELLEG